ncbi:YdbC family protein [Paenactinomyces guangxiensis]|uniref:YdbC family protein n=1 Tax=Paenactinomyces guangxiensis TaxID=1490290 RepID=A0A7W1WQX0_9BACL|nr:YdbC family protein [Paenactinomyces guangxiensis]MBA4494391.1 YdbC family protein [Paenactinomyces guangxiensis]MBH8591554.1 YdbC family protein [Paenactinomyces guangxiensis]
MLIKWIVCQVPGEKREAFSQAQEAWKILKDADGFYGQWGGWNIYRPSEACIISLWQDQNTYDRFMSFDHDTIFRANQQQHTYQSISVTLAQHTIEISSESGGVVQALTGKWLQAADVIVDPEREQPFLETQQTVWNPALEQSTGMLGAMVAKVNQPACRYQIFSFWREKAYQQDITSLPLLQKQEGSDRDTTAVISYLVERNERWLVKG